MPYTEISGINIHYEVRGSGPPVLMMAPGGFDATIEKWSAPSASGIWDVMRPLETLTDRYTCIAYDRREAGLSGGRVERISWSTYADEGMGLLRHVGIDRAFVLGGCMGCSTAAAFGVAYPEATLGLLLHWPVGGVRWRHTELNVFQTHVDFVKKHGLAAVVELAREKKTFETDPAAGPWASAIATNEEFARNFQTQDQDRYLAVVALNGQTLFDRETATGADSAELMALKVPTLIIPGADSAHATSAARYLEECLDNSVYHDVPVAEQTPEKVQQWITEFLATHSEVLVG